MNKQILAVKIQQGTRAKNSKTLAYLSCKGWRGRR